MRGIILAGGRATRLYPSTLYVTKQLLPVYDRPMVLYPVNTLLRAGITDIMVIVSPEYLESFQRLFGTSWQSQGISISLATQKVPRGIPEAFMIGERHIGDDSVALILGDNIILDQQNQVRETLLGYDPNQGAEIFVREVSDPERYGVAELDGQGRVISLEEKPQVPKSRLAVIGLYLYGPEVVTIAKNLKKGSRGETEITDVNIGFLNQDRLRATQLTCRYVDAGTHNALLNAGVTARQFLLENPGFWDPRLTAALATCSQQAKDEAQTKLFGE